jgi:archaellum biogenesis ATPase FlaH
MYSAEQSAIINAIYSTKKIEGPKVMITDSLSTMMVVSDRKRRKNPKTQTNRKLMDQQEGKMWVSHATRTQTPQPKKP